MHNLLVEPEAKKWLTRNVTKKSEQMDNLPYEELRKHDREIKHWKLLKKKFNTVVPVENGKFVYSLSRAELKSVQLIAIEAAGILDLKIIPGYQERVDKSINKKTVKRYETYLTRATNTYNQITSILQTLGEKL